MPGIVTRAGVVLGDDWEAPGTSFRLGGTDRLDVTVYNGDALVQFSVATGWDPPDGLLVKAGVFRSLPGLSILYPPQGPTGIRFRRGAAGVASLVDFAAFVL